MSTKLINKSDIKKAIGLKGVWGDIVASCAMWIMGLNKINRLYANSAKYDGKEFSESILKSFNVKYIIDDASLDNIPADGSCIFVSNHPFGGVDGLILYSIVSNKRDDFKIMTNFVLSYIPNLKEDFLPVNPFSNKGIMSSFSGIRSAVEHIEKGHSLGIFPAGEVATYYGKGIIEDLNWQPSAIKLIANAKVPVIPVYFHGTNSKFFHLIGRIHPFLRTLRLPRELINKQGKTITLRIGKSIPVSDIDMYQDHTELGEYLRSRCYALEANLPEAQKYLNENRLKSVRSILAPLNVGAILQELKSHPESLLFEVASFQCYLLDYDQIPTLMYEIGRKREEAFRAVGEGTNREIDIDEFDTYYKHLILWDTTNYCVVGAYRLGIGKNILVEKGLTGFYTNTLFDFKPKLIERLDNTIELGRSFVSTEYQRDALPLMLLIKGLLISVLRYPDCRYLMGPVSISSWIPLFYQSLIYHYLNNNCLYGEPAEYAVAKSPFVPDFLRVDPAALLGRKMDSPDMLDRFLMRLSNNTYRLPTLVKKYIKLNSKVLSFNVDKEFNYCIDALIILDMKDIPENDIQMLTRDISPEEQEKIISNCSR